MSASAPIRTLLQRAATLRATGAGWDRVAEDVKREVSTVKHWPSEYRDEWVDIYQQAHEDVVAEAEAEAWHTQRLLLRTADSESVRQSAAHSIMSIAQKTRPVKQQVEHSGSVQLQWVGGLTEVYSDGE